MCTGKLSVLADARVGRGMPCCGRLASYRAARPNARRQTSPPGSRDHGTRPTAVGFASPSRPRGPAALDPHETLTCRPTVAGSCSTGDASSTGVGATRCVIRRTPGAAEWTVTNVPARITRPRHRTDRGGVCRPGGPAGQAAPDPYRTGVASARRTRMPDRGCAAQPCRGEALPRPAAPEGAATRSAACGTAATLPGTTTDASPPAWAGPPGRRVRHRLIPTGRG